MHNSNLLIFLVILFEIFHNCAGYLVTVDAHGEECFFDKAETGTKMALTFEVVDGGFTDIDVKITGPDGNVIYQGEGESSSKYTFAAPSTGIYTYCFNNEKATAVPKIVMFSMEVGEAPRGTPGAVNEADAGHVKLEDMIRELSGSLTSVKHEQEYMHVRDEIHRAINDNTNSRVVLWSTFEALVLVVMTVGQV